jgi:hypothetical protein
MLGLLGLRIIEATGADIADLGEEHGYRVLRVRGEGSKVVLVPLPPAVGRANHRAIDGRSAGPILLNSRRACRHPRRAVHRLPGREGTKLRFRLLARQPRITYWLAPGRHEPARAILPGADGVIPTIPVLDRISAALDADLIVEIAPHAA